MQAPNQPTTFSFLDLIKRTFSIYRENFAVIIGLVAFVTIPISLLNIIVSPQPLATLTASVNAANDTPDMTGLLLSLLSLLQTILITAPLTYLVSEYLFGRKISISEAFSGIGNRFGQIGCGVLLIGFTIGLMAVFIIFLVILFPFALIVSGLLIHIIVASSALMFPVLTLENVNPSASLSRSWSLGKRRLWNIFGISLVVTVISLIIGTFLGNVVGNLILSISPNMNANVLFLIITIVTDIVGIFISPISPIAFTLMYYHIRTTTEGLDDVLNAPTKPVTRPIDLISPVSRFQFDAHDWRNIAILSAIGLILGIVGNSLIQQLIQQFAPGLK